MITEHLQAFVSAVKRAGAAEQQEAIDRIGDLISVLESDTGEDLDPRVIRTCEYLRATRAYIARTAHLDAVAERRA